MRNNITAKTESIGPIYDAIIEADRQAREDARLRFLWEVADLMNIKVVNSDGTISRRPEPY